MKLYRIEHYRKNPAAYKARAVAKKRETKRLFFDWLATQACIDCGESDPIVLDCDHVRGQKVADLKTMTAAGATWVRIQAEIAKCEVRCSNCHRKKTARERGFTRRNTTQPTGS
jgi:hypothetical protein